MRERQRSQQSITPTRRQILLGIGAISIGAGISGTLGTDAVFNSNATRTSTISTADDPNAVIGLMINDPVQKGKTEPLIDIENNTGVPLDVTVSLDQPSQGTLYGPNGQGNSVTLMIDPTVTGSVDIKADVNDTTIPFTINATNTAVTVQASRETTAVSGNSPSGVNIKKLQDFVANPGDDNWTIKNIDIRDSDDGNLSSIEFEVTDAGGNTRSSDTVTCGCNNGSKYSPKGNPSVTLQPDDASYDVLTGEDFTLRVTAYDADGNYDFASRQTTA